MPASTKTRSQLANAVRRENQGEVQRGYLASWIDRNHRKPLAGIPLAVQGAFTLALHDRLNEAVGAAAPLVGAVFSRQKEHRRILQTAEADET